MSFFAVLRLGFVASFLLLVMPTFVSAGLFPKSSLVKMIDAKGFREIMKLNQTSLIAFVAPWCGHCQRMVPEMSKAAIGLHPLIGTYAVDCDDDVNKQLCAQQGIQGFPTVKVFPRGKYLPPMLLEQERTASSLYNFAARRVPKVVDALKKLKDVTEWVEKNKPSLTVALLLTKDSKVPLLWKVLANKYTGTTLKFGAHSDKDWKALAELTGSVVGGDDDGTKSKILVWIEGKGPKTYTGVSKFEPLTGFFDRLLDGKDKEELLKGLIVENKPPFDAETESEPETVRRAADKDTAGEPAEKPKPLSVPVGTCEGQECRAGTTIPPKDEL